MIKLVDRYVGRTVLIGVLGVWIALTLLMTMFSFLNELGDVGSSGRLGEIAWYVVLRSVGAAYTVFPVSALLGAMIGVGGLAAGNELVALRTAGASRLRLSGSVLGAVGILTLAVMVLGEWVMPPAEQQALALKRSQVDASGVVGDNRGLWIRDGNDFINIERSVVYSDDTVQKVTLHNVVRYDFDEDDQLRAVDRATAAVHDGEQWRLTKNTRVDIGNRAVTRTYVENTPWSVGFGPELLLTSVIRPRYMSLRGIVDQLRYLRQNALDSRTYDTAFWSKALFPLTVLTLVLSGMPFLFGSSRTHSLGLRIFIGMSLGGVFMIVTKTAQNFTEAYAVPAVAGTALPPLLLAVAVVIVLRRSV